jgi:hypothetical protein
MANWWGDGEKPTKAQIAARGKAKRIAGAKFKQTVGLAVARELGGTKALRKAIKQIEAKVRQKVIEQSLRKALRVSRRAIRGAVPVSQKYAKHLVGLFVGTPKGGKVWQAKAGLGVGKATEKKRKAQRTGRNTYTTRKGETKNRGVGIAAANIHWAVLGTRDRNSKKPDRYTGSMPKLIPDAVINGWKGSQAEFINVFRTAMQEGIDKAVAQAGAKSGD